MKNERLVLDAGRICNAPGFSLAGSIFIVIVFSLISVLTVLGNGIVIWIVLTTKRMRTVTNYFLVNLSVGDMLSVFQIIPNVYYVIRNDWVFGLPYCQFSQFFTAFGISISVLTFTGLTADRYTAIKYPLRPRSRPSTILGIISFIWIISFVIGAPCLVTAKLSEDFMVLNATDDQMANQTLLNGCRKCHLGWSQAWMAGYDISLFLLMYILPMIILFATYIPITIKLWSDRVLGEITRGQLERIKSKHKVVKMLIAVMVIFAICWLPYQLFFLILHAPINPEDPNLPIFFIVFYGLAMSNSMYNPFIYCTMNRKFRDGFLNTIGCCPFVKKYRRKCQRKRFHQNLQTIVSSSENEINRQQIPVIEREPFKQLTPTSRPPLTII